jgi:hypothetical protein
MDRDGKQPFDLLDEIEKELNIHLHPLTWPINMGKDFKGVYNLYDKSLLLFNPNQKATEEDIIPMKNMSDPLLDTSVGEKDAKHLRDEVELIEGVYGEFNSLCAPSGAMAVAGTQHILGDHHDRRERELGDRYCVCLNRRRHCDISIPHGVGHRRFDRPCA